MNNNQRSGPIIYHEKLITLIAYYNDSGTEENNFYVIIVIVKTVWNATLEFLHHGIKRKCVILRCKLYKTNKYQNCHVSFLSNFFSCVSAKYYLNWFTARKVITKIKRWTFLSRHRIVWPRLYIHMVGLEMNMGNYPGTSTLFHFHLTFHFIKTL